MIFEVLSPSTEKYDRGLKFQHYRTLDSLRDYILVNQEQARIEQFTRQPDGTWTFRDYQGPDEELKIDAIGVTIPLRRIYDRVSILRLRTEPRADACGTVEFVRPTPRHWSGKLVLNCGEGSCGVEPSLQTH